MNKPTLAALSITLLLAAAGPSFAYEAPSLTPPRPSASAVPAEPAAQRFDQVLYKGVVGNLLDAVPMESEQRTTLQKTNAIVSGALSGKSLATLAKLAHPGFLIGGLVWGLWAAANIEPSQGNAPASEAILLAAAKHTDVTGGLADTAGTESTIEPEIRRESAAPNVARPAAAGPHRPTVVRIWLAPSAY